MFTSGRIEVEFEFAPEQPFAEGTEGSEGIAFGLALELAMHAVQTAFPGHGVEQLRYGPPLALNVRRRLCALVDPSTRRVTVQSSTHGTADSDIAPALRGGATPVTHLEGNVVQGGERAWLGRLGAAVRGRPLGGRALSSREVEAELRAADGGSRSVPEVVERVVLHADRVEATLRFGDGAWPSYCLHPAIVDAGWLLATLWEHGHGRRLESALVHADAFHVLDPGAKAERLWLIQLPAENEARPPALALAAESDGNITAVLYGLTVSEAGPTSSRGIQPALRRGAMPLELAQRPAAEQRELVAAYVERAVLAAIGIAPALEPRTLLQRLPRNVPFRDLGVTSAQAVTIASTLSSALGHPVSSTVLFDHPTIDQLTAAIVAGRLKDAPRAERDRAASQPAGAIGGIAPALRGVAMSMRDQIAVIGMGCRLPGGVAGPDDFWRLLADGIDAVRPIVGARLSLLGSSAKAPRFLGALDDIDQFDARFFGISDREASAMDPQQRILLEVTWHALEHAGVIPSSLMNSRTGVFVGVAANEYARLLPERDAYSVVGNAPSVAAGRLSYVLGTRGPSLTIDGACSSSLAAVCMACDSLMNGDADLAIAGGANLVLDGTSSEGLAAAGALSPRGRCAAFSDDADGYVRGEGCGIVVLRRLSDALARGERVLAVVRGHSTGHGGRSNGLAAPNGEAQADLMRRALARCGVEARDVGYVEAHGTGTTIGDAVELRSLAETYGAGSGRREPVWIGTAKTNIGHLEAAAGIAGFIKAVLVLNRACIPPNLHHATPLRSFDWQSSGLKVVTALEPWPDRKQRLAAVNAFGISGAYAHVVLEAAPLAEATVGGITPIEQGPMLVALSGRSEGSVRRQAAEYARHLATFGQPSQLALTAGRHRDHFDRRAAVVGSSARELVFKLGAVASGERPVQQRLSASPTIAFLYSGLGSQYLGMARGLFQSDAAFREAFEQCDAMVAAESGSSTVPLVLGTADPALLERAIASHPALFCVQYALGRAWQNWGITPDYLLGHSFGEYAAACLAGVFSLPDAVGLVVLRARLIDALPADGAMLALSAGLEDVEELLRAGPFALEVGALNAPRQIVVSGDAVAIAQLGQRAQALGIRTQALPVRRAFHSRLVDPILDEFERAVAAVGPLPARGKLVSSSLGRPVDEEVCAPAYWRTHMRDPVRFAAGVEALAELGAQVFVEIGPQPVLLPAAAACVQGSYRWLPSLRRGRDDPTQMLQSAAEIYVAGRNPQWDHLLGARGGTTTTIPGYAFERRRHWVSDAAVSPRHDPYYRIEWVSAPVFAPDRARDSNSRWILCGDDSANLTAMAGAFDELGVSTSLVEPEHALAQSVTTGAGSILYLMSADPEVEDLRQAVDVHAATTAALRRVLEAVRRWTAPGGSQPRVWLAFQHRGRGDDGAAAAIESALWSLGRVVRVEEPELWGGMASVQVDVLDSEHARVLAGALLERVEDQLRIEPGGVLRVPRLVRAPAPPGAGHLDREGSYLVTGGLGHVGLHVAEWLAAQGVQHLLLTGRQLSRAADARDPHGRAPRLLNELRARGVSVRSVAVDVCDGDAMRELFRTASPRIAGIFHAAGTRADVALRDIDASQLDVVLRAKVLGAWTLHELAREFPVDHFVMFSSLASVVGGREQGGYAAANGFLDGLAAQRRRLGLPGLSIAWGPWGGEGGMAAPDAHLLASIGVAELQPERALEALRALLHADAACWTVADVDWQPFRGVYETRRRQPMVAGLGDDTDARSTADAGLATAAFLDELAALPEAERSKRLHARLKGELRQVLAADHGDDELERDFSQLQLDSLGAVQLRSRIERLLGVQLSSTVIFDHPSLVRLVAHLLEEASASLKHPEAAQ